MCGIFGLLNKNVNSKLIFNDKKINQAFIKGVNRGPEISKYLRINNTTEFGFHRLAINGLNENSHQPLNINKCILICNGEIYNYKELYNENKDFTAVTDSDCEIIIHMYLKYGIDETLKMINGEFAFALYDLEKNLMYLARDPHGVRALYLMENYYDNFTNPIIFGSELKMLHPFLNLSDKLKIRQFKPGHYMTFNNTNDKYWTTNNIMLPYYNRLNFYKAPNYITEDVALVKIATALENSIKRRVTTSDRPIACLLSGGLDSSLVTSLVSKYYKKGQLETYSIGMPGSEDLKYSQMVADYLGTKHTQIILSEDDFFNAIPDVIKSIESYDTTTVRASVGNYLVSKYISEHSEAKVIFNGDGSDEVTGGYMYFHKAPGEKEFDVECNRLLDNIYLYDVLRSDKSISSNGLEPRTPFLDKEFVDTYMMLPIKLRYHPGRKQCEKYLLRKAFSGKNLLPDEVLWRTKEAFSDGVSSQKKSWFEIIDEKISEKHGDKYCNKFFDKSLYDVNPPTTQEQNYYRDLFESFYCSCGYIVPYFWMPKYVDAKDSSARTLQVYSSVLNTDTKN